jgi:hypothetical protein
VPTILYLRAWNEMAVGHGEAKLGWVDNTVVSVSDENWKAGRMEDRAEQLKRQTTRRRTDGQTKVQMQSDTTKTSGYTD